LVADPRLSHEVARVRRIRFELLAELAHKHPQVLRLFLRRFAPDGLEQGTVAEDAVRMTRHIDEQLEPLRRETHFVAADVDAAGIDVDAEISRLERRDV